MIIDITGLVIIVYCKTIENESTMHSFEYFVKLNEGKYLGSANEKEQLASCLLRNDIAHTHSSQALSEKVRRAERTNRDRYVNKHSARNIPQKDLVPLKNRGKKEHTSCV